jgi:ribosomal protein L14E/L6E/L27E
MKKKQYLDYGAFLAAVKTSSNSCMTGRLVRSKSGRDKGRYYLVLAEERDRLYLADGRRRGIENPKRKNIRHIQIVHKVAADLMNNKDGNLPSDEEIRAALTHLMKEGE